MFILLIVKPKIIFNFNRMKPLIHLSSPKKIKGYPFTLLLANKIEESHTIENTMEKLLKSNLNMQYTSISDLWSHTLMWEVSQSDFLVSFLAEFSLLFLFDLRKESLKVWQVPTIDSTFPPNIMSISKHNIIIGSKMFKFIE